MKARSFCILLGIVVLNVATADTIEEFSINRPYGQLIVSVISPPEGKLAQDPLLLLNFSADRHSALPDGRYGGITRPFLDAGYRIASFDLPSHGDRVDQHGSGLSGLSASIAAGCDPFSLFVEDGQAVIDELITRKLVKSGNIVVSGVSRGGYCALRLASADSRIGAVSAMAPVTDWRALKEFAPIKEKPEVAGLDMENFATDLAGRRVYVAIGNADSRVSTAACTRFVLAVNKAEANLDLEESSLRYHLVDDSKDHSLNTRWRREGIQFLMTPVRSSVQQDLPE